jgi:hypothetical protein
MTWFSTKVERLNDLSVELQRLQDDGHTIFSILNHDGKLVIISNTP